MNRQPSMSEKDLKATVRTVCDDVRQKLEGKRSGAYITKHGLVEIVHRRTLQAAKKQDPKDAWLIANLPKVMPGYWLLIDRGLTALISAELQRKIDGLPGWESYYDFDQKQFNWIPAAVITAALAVQMSKERKEGANADMKMARIWDLVSERLNGTKLLFADVRNELRPQIKAILAQ